MSAFADRFADYLAETDARVRKHGWALQGVFARADDPDPGPSFTYTVGLLAKAGPSGDPLEHELVIVGLDGDASGFLLNLVAQHEVENGPLPTGVVLGQDVVATPVPDVLMLIDANPALMAEHDMPASLAIRWAGTYGGWTHGLVPVRQLVFADDHGRFPWHKDCDEKFVAHQPLLGRSPGEPSLPEGTET